MLPRNLLKEAAILEQQLRKQLKRFTPMFRIIPTFLEKSENTSFFTPRSVPECPIFVSRSAKKIIICVTRKQSC